MFLGSPHCFVIVKNLKRNRQDKNRIPAHKSIFHPAAWEAAASEWAPGCLHLRVGAPNPVTPPEVGGGCLQSRGHLVSDFWEASCSSPRAGSGALKFSRMQGWW